MVVPSPTDVVCPNDIKLSSSFLNKKFPVLPIKALKVPLLAKPKWVDFNIKPDKPEVLGVFTILPLAFVIILAAVEDDTVFRLDCTVFILPCRALDEAFKLADTDVETWFISPCKALDEAFRLVVRALDEAFKLADTDVALGKLPLTEAAVAKPLPAVMFTVPVIDKVSVLLFQTNLSPKLNLPVLSI